MSDYGTVLGVSQDASLADIKKAFRKKALELHPDHGGDEQAFRELQEAFRALISGQNQEIGYDPAVRDPFADPNYHKHTFFAPEHDAIAEFERMVRAQGCSYCNGRGVISKLVDPNKGFFGREERFCSCQIVE